MHAELKTPVLLPLYKNNKGRKKNIQQHLTNKKNKKSYTLFFVGSGGRPCKKSCTYGLHICRIPTKPDFGIFRRMGNGKPRGN